MLIIASLVSFLILNKNGDDNSILIENSNITMLNNSNYSFKALCTKNDCNLKYISSDESIFTVNEEGDILSFGIGEATLIIESGDKKKEVSVYVTDI